MLIAGQHLTLQLDQLAIDACQIHGDMVVCFKILRAGLAGWFGDPDILRGTVGASWGWGWLYKMAFP